MNKDYWTVSKKRVLPIKQDERRSNSKLYSIHVPSSHHIEQFRAGLGEAIRITSPKVQNNNVSEASFSRPKYKNNAIDDSN